MLCHCILSITLNRFYLINYPSLLSFFIILPFKNSTCHVSTCPLFARNLSEWVWENEWLFFSDSWLSLSLLHYIELNQRPRLENSVLFIDGSRYTCFIVSRAAFFAFRSCPGGCWLITYQCADSCAKKKLFCVDWRQHGYLRVSERGTGSYEEKGKERQLGRGREKEAQLHSRQDCNVSVSNVFSFPSTPMEKVCFMPAMTGTVQSRTYSLPQTSVTSLLLTSDFS